MAKPFLRYLPAKLKPLSAPAIWIPLTIFALLSVLLLEYYQNPEWFERDPITNANPDSDLTPEEQAKLSEIDTVDLLLKGAQVSSPLSNPKVSGEGLDGLTPTDLAAETAEGDRQLANKNDPFGAYAAEYEFPGANRAGTPNPNSAASNGAPSGSFNFGSAAGSPPLSTTPSALSEAIDRQQAIKANEAANEPQGFSQNNRSPNAAQAPGNVPVPFIRTTPAMSPPVGTTGYQAPATSNLPNFNVAPLPASRPPAAAPLPSGSISPGQIGSVQPPPIARPIQSNQIPTGGTVYTAPRSTQPEQNRRAR